MNGCFIGFYCGVVHFTWKECLVGDGRPILQICSSCASLLSIHYCKCGSLIFFALFSGRSPRWYLCFSFDCIQRRLRVLAFYIFRLHFAWFGASLLEGSFGLLYSSSCMIFLICVFFKFGICAYNDNGSVPCVGSSYGPMETQSRIGNLRNRILFTTYVGNNLEPVTS